MKLRLTRYDNGKQFASAYSDMVPYLHEWVQDAIVEEFRPWPNDSISDVDCEGGEIIMINGEIKALLTISAERRRAA